LIEEEEEEEEDEDDSKQRLGVCSIARIDSTKRQTLSSMSSVVEQRIPLTKFRMS
jgi:hypothetical protein